MLFNLYERNGEYYGEISEFNNKRLSRKYTVGNLCGQNQHDITFKQDDRYGAKICLRQQAEKIWKINGG